MDLKQQVTSLVRRGELAQARLLLERVLDQGQRDPEVLILLATLHGMTCEYDKAKLLARQAIAITPDNADAHYCLGNALRSLGDTGGALSNYQAALQAVPGHVQALLGIGVICADLNRYDEAQGYLRAALRQQPGNPFIHSNIGATYLKMGNPEAAIESFCTAIKIAPVYDAAHANLGRAYERVCRYQDAIASYREAMRIRPGNHEILTSLGNIFNDRGMPRNAEQCYRKAAALEPCSSRYLCNLGNFLAGRGLLEEAEAIFGKAQSCSPDSEDPVAGIADIYIKRGDYNKALGLLQPLIRRGSVNVNVVLGFAKVCDYADCIDAAIEALERVMNTEGLSVMQRRLLFFSLGRLYDRLGVYAKAMSLYCEGNRLKSVRFDTRSWVKNTDVLISFFSSTRCATLPLAGRRSELPVFIVGMPRSGTTLVEQVLASHPSVYGAGELDDIAGAVASLADYPECLNGLSRAELDRMADGYLEKLRALAPGCVRITDKMPSNYQHMGFIANLFPGARFIHCTRNPLDTCLSIYFQDFVGRHDYAYDMRHIGLVFREYRRLMSHWKKVLKVPVLEVSYEDMVGDFDRVSRRIVTFCGLDWDDECSRFSGNRRIVLTSSAQQVRQSLYSSSIGRHANYQGYLAPLNKALRAEVG